MACLLLDDVLIYNGDSNGLVPDIGMIAPHSVEAVEYYRSPAENAAQVQSTQLAVRGARHPHATCPRWPQALKTGWRTPGQGFKLESSMALKRCSSQVVCAILALHVGLWLSAPPASAQKPVESRRVVTGVVVDRATGRGIAEAVVSSEESPSVATTDSAGRFRLSGLPQGNLVLFAKRLGFEPFRFEVDLARDTAVFVSIRMSLGGHFKTGHSWTPQNRPPRDSVRDWVRVAVG